METILYMTGFATTVGRSCNSSHLLGGCHIAACAQGKRNKAGAATETNEFGYHSYCIFYYDCAIWTLLCPPTLSRDRVVWLQPALQLTQEKTVAAFDLDRNGRNLKMNVGCEDNIPNGIFHKALTKLLSRTSTG